MQKQPLPGPLPQVTPEGFTEATSIDEYVNRLPDDMGFYVKYAYESSLLEKLASVTGDDLEQIKNNCNKFLRILSEHSFAVDSKWVTLIRGNVNREMIKVLPEIEARVRETRRRNREKKAMQHIGSAGSRNVYSKIMMAINIHLYQFGPEQIDKIKDALRDCRPAELTTLFSTREITKIRGVLGTLLGTLRNKKVRIPEIFTPEDQVMIDTLKAFLEKES